MFPINLPISVRHTTLITLTALSTLLLIPTNAIPQSNSKSSSDSSKSQSSKSASSSSKSKSKSISSSDSDSDSANTKARHSNSTTKFNSNRPAYNPAAANQAINPQSFNDQMLSQLIFDLTNQERLRAGLQPFESSSHLAAAAAAHSRDMASRNYFNHKSKGIFNRTDPHERIASAGYQAPRMTAENIAMIPTFNSQRIQTYPGYGRQVIDADYNSYHRMAASAVKQWMDSPGHRENILNAGLTELGVGTAVGLKDNIPYVYLTQNFGG